MVTIDEDDLAILDGCSWRLWQRKEREQAIAVCDKMSAGRSYRLLLHREVAFRMRPDLVSKADRLKIRPVNSNFLDVRRDNLEITLYPRKHGHVRRPRGHRAKRTPQAARKQPPAWSAAGCRLAIDGGDGPAGDPPDRGDGPGA